MNNEPRIRPTEDKFAAVRRGLPATESVAFFNAGSYGPLTAAAGEAILEMAAHEVNAGRFGDEQFERVRELRVSTRSEFAQVLGCDLEEIGLTTSTTAGMNFACWGLNWQEGDEVITTDMEHLGGLAPLYILERRFGVRLRIVDTQGRGNDLLSAMEAAIGPRTRAVVLSHVSWSAGIVLPLRPIAEQAHRAGAVLIVDGAQSAGAIPVDVRGLGVDAYAIPGQKWLCGPEGMGALYVSRPALASIAPSHVGSAAFDSYDLMGGYAVAQEARRFNTPGNPYGPAVAGMLASLRWLVGEIGLDWIYDRIANNTARCRGLLEGIDGVEVITPPGRHAGLLHFTIDGWDPPAVRQELVRRRVVLRSIEHPSCLRVSVGFYNSDDDLRALADGVGEMAKEGPGGSPAKERGR